MIYWYEIYTMLDYYIFYFYFQEGDEEDEEFYPSSPDFRTVFSFVLPAKSNGLFLI